jgi:hypothetical protein
MTEYHPTAKGPAIYSLEFSDGTLLLKGLPLQLVKAIFGDEFWRWDPRVNAWRCEASKYADVLARWRAKPPASMEHWPCENRAPNWSAVPWPKIELPVLRQEQMAAVEAWQKNKNGLVVMPTGTGKTEVALRIMVETKCSTLIVSPIRDLMYQWHRRIFQGLGYDAGMIARRSICQRLATVLIC